MKWTIRIELTPEGNEPITHVLAHAMVTDGFRNGLSAANGAQLRLGLWILTPRRAALPAHASTR
jgi:hypothetical protein